MLSAASGVGNNSVEGSQWKLRIHKKCNGITGRLLANPDYISPRFRYKAWPIDGRPVTQVDADSTIFDVDATFCYLCDNPVGFVTVKVSLPPDGGLGKVQETFLCCNDGTIIRWICGTKDRDEASSASLLQKLVIEDITAVLCSRGSDYMDMYSAPLPVSNLSQT